MKIPPRGAAEFSGRLLSKGKCPNQVKINGQRDEQPVLVFCSYSHHDHPFRMELEAQLSPLVRQKLVTFWSDRRIAPGEKWEQAIDENLERADIILLLVSAYFVQSDYCYTRELQRALERDRQGEARLVPVFIRPCDWEGLDFAHLQGLPLDGKAISNHPDRDTAWTEVVRGIKQIALEMQGGRHPILTKQAVDASLLYTKYDPRAYLRSLSEWRRTAFAHTREIVIAATAEGKPVVLGDALETWMATPISRVAVLIGNPGSGKTYAFRSLAAKLADRSLEDSTNPIPIMISAKRLTWGSPLQALKAAIPEAADLVSEILLRQSGLILLDGLDETLPTDIIHLTSFISELARFLPERVKIGLSCRPPMRDVLLDVFGSRSNAAILFEILSLSESQVARVAGSWSGGIPTGLSSPFAVRLMGILSPHAHFVDITAEVDLYDRATDVLIDRVLGDAADASTNGRRLILQLLLDMAALTFERRLVRLSRFRPGYIPGTEFIALINALIAAGLLALDSDENLTFGHETLFDYFYARLLERELSDWNAAHLARSNLIHGYNVNRFLVPMTLRRPLHQLSALASEVRSSLFDKYQTDTARTTSEPVTNAQFEKFLQDTGWRGDVGFGMWPNFKGPDGESVTSTNVRFDGVKGNPRSLVRRNKPVTGVSWYDAQQFAWWIGGTLPSRLDDQSNSIFLWTSQWEDEPRAYIRLHRTGSVGASWANPDVRSSDIGFCVTLPVRTK